MNRNERRKLMSPVKNIKKSEIMSYLVLRMGSEGEAILKKLSELTEGKENVPGYAGDQFLNCLAEMEVATLQLDSERYVNNLVEALFLARHMAIGVGKIKLTPPAQG